VLGKLKNWDAAEAAYREALRLNPKLTFAQVGLALMMTAKGDLDGAVAAYQEALKLAPNNDFALNNLAWLLAVWPDGIRDGKKAVEYATQACELSNSKKPGWIDTLAAACAEAKDFDNAIKYQKLALSFPEFEKQYAQQARQQIDLFTRKQPYRDPTYARPEVAPPPRPVKP
jgi:tetratricopeptide (TPR) repeat protein